MKKHFGKKTLTLLLAVLMLLTSVPLAAVPAAAVGGTINQSGWAIISSNAKRVDTGAGTFTVCNDGTQDSISVGFLDFDLSAISSTVTAKLNVSAKNSGSNNYNGEAFLEVFSIKPDKRPNVSGATSSNFNNIFGSSGWATNSYTNAKNAKNTLGVLNQPAIAVMRSKEMDNGRTVNYSFDISEAVNNAKKAGQSKLHLAFLNPRSYAGVSSWSDINIFYNSANITYSSSDSNEIPFSAAVTLYKSGSDRGNSTKQTICSDGSNGNTTAVFVKFDLSSVSSDVKNVSFVTSAWRASASNQNVVANIYSVDTTKTPNMTAGTGDQTTQYYDAAFGTGTPNMTAARTYFGASNSLGTISTRELSTNASTISRDITSAVKAAKAAGNNELCLMLINPQNYSGSSSNGWSDIYINPTSTKLVCSNEENDGHGTFNEGKYYVKLVVEVVDGNWWNNLINEAWIGFYYKPTNGTKDEVHLDMPVAPGTFSTVGVKTFEYVLDGFPTRVDIDCGGIAGTNNFSCRANSLWVGPYAGNYTQITGLKTDTIWKIAAQGQDTRKQVVYEPGNSQYPYAKTFEWTLSPSETFVPKSGENSVDAFVVAKDQYGVVMGTQYEGTVSKTDKYGSSINSEGLSLSQNNKSDFVLTVAENAKVANTDHFNGNINVKVSSVNNAYSSASSKEVWITNQKESVTLDPNNGSLSKTDYTVYYGSALNAKINESLNSASFPPAATREGYSFKGFFNSFSGGAKIEDTETVHSDVTYYAQWDINKFTVKFFDSDGNVTTTQTVNYNAAATAPQAPEKASDETNHYTFKNWDTEFSNVKSDLEVKPVFEATAHNFERFTNGDVAPTCTEKGKHCYKCSSCGFTKFEEGEEAKGHSWTLTSVIKDATCEEGGESRYTCSVCFASKTEATEAIGHSYVETIVLEATCTTDGLKKYVCKNCGKTDPAQGGDEGVVITAPGSHDWTAWETVTASGCESTGIRKAKCSRENCEYHNRYYQEVTSPLGHDFSGELLSKESTCTVKGYTYKVCSRCSSEMKVDELPLAEHSLSDWTYAPAPTCTKGGNKFQKCSVCGQNFNMTAVPALGHDYKEDAYTAYRSATCTEPAKERAKCSRCDSYDVRNVAGSSPLGHDCPEDGFESDHNATCVNDGTESSKCVRFEECGFKETRTEAGSALGHNFIGYVYNNDQTCTKNETKTGTCSRCSAKDTVEIEGTKRPHTVDYVFDDNATCTKNGTKSGICETCGQKITVEAANTKLAHKFTSYSVIEEANCISDAIEQATCDYGCGEKSTRFVEGTKGKHDFPDPETEKSEYVSNNDATCKTKGTMSAVCRICKAAKKTVTDPDSALRHNIVFWISDGNATCTEDGTKHGSCVYGCGYSEEGVRDEGSALGHWFRDYVYNSDATCTEDGTRTARCEREFNSVDSEGKAVKVRCSETETLTAEGSALGHEWSEWKLVGNDADCTNGGKSERHCLRDGCVDPETGKSASQTTEVAPLGHNYQWVSVGTGEKDCTVGGERVKVCTVCGNVDESSRTIVPGSAHNFAVTEYIAPTCTEEGKRTVSCTVCGKVYSSEILEKIDHVSSSLDKSTVKEATCNSEGYTGDYICDSCGEVVLPGSVIAKTNNHVFTDYVIVKQATCTEDAVEKAGCSVCAKAENERTVPSSALGHTFSNYVSDGNASCTGIETFTSKCDRCDVTDTIKKAGTALGHDWSDWTTIVEATCSNKGLAERHCKRDGCGTKVEKELRKLSHKESDWIVDKEATCTEEGHRFKQCTAGCGYIFSEEVIPMKKHNFVVSESTATCIDDGYSTYTCTVCKAERKGEIVHALGHDYGEWEITKAPTCARKGEKIVKCQRCGILLAKEEISKTPHHDNDGDGKCDDCKATIIEEPADNCTCICHKKSWAMRMLYSICRAFWKLFKLRSTCPCGAKHY